MQTQTKVKTYGIGTLAYYNAVDGWLIPCRVVGFFNEGTTEMVQVRVTGTRGSWRRGTIHNFAARYTYPREYVKLRNTTRHGYAIVHGWKWENEK